MYTHAPPRRPWRNGGVCSWTPDRMVCPTGKYDGTPRGHGNCPITIRKARVKQRRLDKHLADPDFWDER